MGITCEPFIGLWDGAILDEGGVREEFDGELVEGLFEQEAAALYEERRKGNMPYVNVNLENEK